MYIAILEYLFIKNDRHRRPKLDPSPPPKSLIRSLPWKRDANIDGAGLPLPDMTSLRHSFVVRTPDQASEIRKHLRTHLNDYILFRQERSFHCGTFKSKSLRTMWFATLFIFAIFGKTKLRFCLHCSHG